MDLIYISDTDIQIWNRYINATVLFIAKSASKYALKSQMR